MSAMFLACQRMVKIISRDHLNSATNFPVLSMVDAFIKIGGVVLDFCEGQNRWSGPHRVIDLNNKIVKIDYNYRLVQSLWIGAKQISLKKKSGE